MIRIFNFCRPVVKASPRRRMKLAFVVCILGTCTVAVRAHAQEAAPAEVKVRGRASESQRLQRSAEAVTVVNTDRAKRQSADMGEVLARIQGVALRRMGGLGSDARFSLNGFSDDQIRFFLDGVPLDVAGYPFGIANVPVNLIDRIEIYRGVVPVRFGADALGGAVNLAGDRRYDTGANVSYQFGSFGTQRFTLGGRYRHEPSGIVARANGFFDVAKNNYDVDVLVPQTSGAQIPMTVRRFHDGYLAYGVSVEAGVVDRPWAKRLLLRGFTTGYDKDLQNDAIMSRVYGEPTYGERVSGVTVRYEQPLRENVELELVGSYAYRSIDFVDKSHWQYNWLGQRSRELRDFGRGEIDAKPRDQTEWQHTGFARATLAWTVAPEHTIRLTTTPTYATRTGEGRLRDMTVRDPLSARNTSMTLVSGAEYEFGAESRFQNIAFVKNYVYHVDGEDIELNGAGKSLEKDSLTFGAGDTLRYRVNDWLYAKASYEYATRLPRPDEVFGNGVLITPNLQLEPEVSHNANLGPRIELRRSRAGDIAVDVNAFLRESDKLIVLFGTERFYSYQNVYKTRAIGVEGSFAWTAPFRWLTLDGTVTYQDVRNASSEGLFGAFDGDRVPSKPWLFGSWGARLRFPHVLRADDWLEAFYVGRYVHRFYRNWESFGALDTKDAIDAQVTHAVGVTYWLHTDLTTLSTSFEVQNLTDAKVFDFFGVQRPGRAYFVKVTADL
ncbi:TonB-dependent siderophore myxochelin receptor MxcH [Pendulispora rubella]|uniref:TonB-dependent siderophore myxochelin receptor MxcH n=2 Tax=Pendulispora rubella TaxID=2741070 RepID=A0ABZ2L850_9BACT